jgi:RNA-directed DNA polymerase
MTRTPRGNYKLSDCWLYAVASRADLARRLSTKGFTVSSDELDGLAKDTGNFRLFTIKKNGKERAIQEPKPRLQRVHARIHKLLSRVAVPSYLHSAVAGRSYLSNAGAHASDTAMIKVDVKKFFQSVPRVAIFEFFHGVLKCRRDVAGLLGDLLTFDAHLPTGSSASPIIAYYAFKPMFDAIATLAAGRGLTMTCYVDDMAISGLGASKGGLYEVKKIIATHGLKSHKAYMFTLIEPKVITGVCLASDGPRVPNKLHLKIKKGFDDLKLASTLETKQKAARPLLGRLEAAGQIDPVFKARAATLRSSMRK